MGTLAACPTDPRPAAPAGTARGDRRILRLIGLSISLVLPLLPRGEGGLFFASLLFGTPVQAKPAADLYLDLDPNARRLIATRRGQVFLVCEARNDTVRPGQLGRWGHCPPGWFRVGPPVNTGTSVKFGPNFLSLSDSARGGPMSTYRRAGIGIHGGGTGLPRSGTAAYQGWRATLGCIRLQNQSMRSLVALVLWTRKGNGTVWIRVGENQRVRRVAR